MEGEFQDQGQIDQYLEEWLSPRGSQSVQYFFYKEEKQESIWIEDSDREGSIITNQDTDGGTPTMVVIKWSESLKGLEKI